MHWIAIASAVAGRPGQVCEDAAETVTNGVVVADGLGSTGFGARASRLAVDVALDALSGDSTTGLPVASIGALLQSRFSDAVAGDRAMATTCLFAFATTARVLVGQVGDGLVVVLLSDGGVFLLEDGRGSYANVTDSLPLVAPRVEAFASSQIEGVLLATDGVADDLVPERVPELLRTLVSMARQEGATAATERLRAWLTTWRTRQSTDDRSVGLLVRGKGAKET